MSSLLLSMEANYIMSSLLLSMEADYIMSSLLLSMEADYIMALFVIINGKTLDLQEQNKLSRILV